VVFTIGHSTHELDALVSLLHDHGVAALADVRASPGSRRLPQFNRDLLERTLPERGLAYVHVAELGGRRRPVPDSPNAGWEVEGFRAYADHMASDEFAHGLARLEELAGARPTAVMCAEALWWRCHRRLVADALTVRGWEVRHIGAAGKVTIHELPPFAVVGRDGRISYPPAQGELPVD
jgi:uncharacterized protein (DUF488 family)